MGVQNIFEFLADENDDNKARAQPKKVVADDKKAAPAAKPKPVGDKPAKPVGDRPARPPKDDKPKAAGDAQRPPRAPREPREPREPRPPRDNANRPPRQSAPRHDNAGAAPAPAGAAPVEANLDEKPQSQVGRRGDRPPRQAGDRDKSNTRVFKDRVRHENPKEGRIFDRKSGTGRSERENKKGGSGKANWGKEGEEAKELLEEAPAKEVKEGEVQDEKQAGDEAAAEAAEKPQEPPAKPTLGLDEYQAKKQQERANLESLLSDFKKKETKERNPSEEQSWDGFKVLKRDEETKAAQAKNKDKAGAKKEKKGTPLAVNFAAAEPKPFKGKGKGKAPGEGKTSAPATPDVTNKDAFPALRATPTPVATSS